MNIITITLLALLTLAVLCVSALIFLMCWIAKGEPDVNGDPERDACRSRHSPLLTHHIL